MDEILKEVVIIKWGVVCIAFSIWCFALYFLSKEIPKWWKSFGKKGDEQVIGFHVKK